MPSRIGLSLVTFGVAQLLLVWAIALPRLIFASGPSAPQLSQEPAAIDPEAAEPAAEPAAELGAVCGESADCTGAPGECCGGSCACGQGGEFGASAGGDAGLVSPVEEPVAEIGAGCGGVGNLDSWHRPW